MSPADRKLSEAAVALARTDATPAAAQQLHALRQWIMSSPFAPLPMARIEIAVRAAYEAGREDERARAHRERMADMLDNARDGR